jgi:hypothetical protein
VARPPAGAAGETRHNGEAPPGAADGARLRTLLDIGRQVVAPSTLLAALLFYFGWVYTNARSLYFGIDPSVLGYSNQDYILRSIDVVLIPLSVLLLLAVILASAHVGLCRRLETGTHPRLVTMARRVLIVLGLAFLVVWLSGVAERPVFGTQFMVTPLSLGAGVGLIAYASALVDRIPGREGRRTGTGATEPVWFRPLVSAAVGLLVAVSLFGGVGHLARRIGEDRAHRLTATLAYQPGVAVFSKEALHLGGPGVLWATIEDDQSAYRFRYRGLKLLVRAAGKYFLLPSGWTPTENGGAAIVLPDDGDLRFEFTPR